MGRHLVKLTIFNVIKYDFFTLKIGRELTQEAQFFAFVFFCGRFLPVLAKTRRMQKRLTLVLGLLFGFSGLSASALGQTLEESMAAAYANNPTILAQRAKVRATDEEVAQALSNWRPTVEIEGEAGTSAVHSNTATATNQGQHREPRSLNLTIEQVLYRGGRTLAATSEAENSVKTERARLPFTISAARRSSGSMRAKTPSNGPGCHAASSVITKFGSSFTPWPKISATSCARLRCRRQWSTGR